MTAEIFVMARRQPSRLARPGFTLTEMMVVLVIIGLVAAVVGPRLFNRLDDARRRTALVQIANLEAGVDLFRIDVGRVPTEVEGLRSLVAQPVDLPSWDGPYLAKFTIPKDPWGRDFLYQVSPDGLSYKVISLGSDGKVGGIGNAKDLASEGDVALVVSSPRPDGCVAPAGSSCPAAVASQ